RIELEHVVVAGDHEPGANLLCQPGRVTAAHVPDLAVDREERDVDVEWSEQVGHPVEYHGIARVVDDVRTHLDNEAEVKVTPLLVRRELIVGGRDGGECKSANLFHLPAVHRIEPGPARGKPFRREFLIC